MRVERECQCEKKCLVNKARIRLTLGAILIVYGVTSDC